MSNSTASKILALNPHNFVERSQIDTLLRENPEVGKTPVAYSYTLEYGSDGCWDRTETGITTLREWGHRAVPAQPHGQPLVQLPAHQGRVTQKTQEATPGFFVFELKVIHTPHTGRERCLTFSET